MHPARLLALGAAILLVGCARQPGYSAPAPLDALDCALEEAVSMGYERIEGDAASREIRVGKRRARPIDRQEPRPERELGEVVLADLSDIAWESRLRLSHASGQLRVEVLSQDEASRDVGEEGDAVADAQRLIALCT